mgnify:CR=1 FL=1
MAVRDTFNDMVQGVKRLRRYHERISQKLVDPAARVRARRTSSSRAWASALMRDYFKD